MSLASRLVGGAMIVMASIACESTPTGPPAFGGEGLKATVEAGQITLSNESGKTVRYIAMEAAFAARANWCLCTGSRRIAAGEQVTLSYSEIYGYDPAKENRVLIYWGVENSSDQPAIEPAAIRTIVVPL